MDYLEKHSQLIDQWLEESDGDWDHPLPDELEQAIASTLDARQWAMISNGDISCADVLMEALDNPGISGTL